jgi:hypothetical protein
VLVNVVRTVAVWPGWASAGALTDTAWPTTIGVEPLTPLRPR